MVCVECARCVVLHGSMRVVPKKHKLLLCFASTGTAHRTAGTACPHNKTGMFDWQLSPRVCTHTCMCVHSQLNWGPQPTQHARLLAKGSRDAPPVQEGPEEGGRCPPLPTAQQQLRVARSSCTYSGGENTHTTHPGHAWCSHSPDPASPWDVGAAQRLCKLHWLLKPLP